MNAKTTFIVLSVLAAILAVAVGIYLYHQRSGTGAVSWRPEVDSYVGRCRIVRGNTRLAASPGMALYGGDTIHTDTSSAIRIIFNRRDYIFLHEGAAVVLHVQPRTGLPPSVILELLAGRIFSDVELLAKRGGDYGIVTARARSRIRGTAFTVEVDPRDNKSTFCVIKGDIDVKKRRDTTTIHVPEGHTLVIPSENNRRRSRSMSLREFNTLVHWIRGGVMRKRIREFESRIDKILTCLARRLDFDGPLIIRSERENLDIAVRHKTIRGPPRKDIRSRDIGSDMSEAERARVQANMIYLHKKALIHKNPFRKPDAIARVIREGLEGLEYYYERRLRSGKTFEGNLLVEFVIYPDGHTDHIRIVSGSLKNEDFENTVVEHVRSLRFKEVPGSVGSMTIAYPLDFRVTESK